MAGREHQPHGVVDERVVYEHLVGLGLQRHQFRCRQDRLRDRRRNAHPVNDLALVKLKAPKKIALSATTTNKVGKFSVTIQNRGPLTETTIASVSTLVVDIAPKTHARVQRIFAAV
jgi:hypothetical protein